MLIPWPVWYSFWRAKIAGKRHHGCITVISHGRKQGGFFRGHESGRHLCLKSNQDVFCAQGGVGIKKRHIGSIFLQSESRHHHHGCFPPWPLWDDEQASQTQFFGTCSSCMHPKWYYELYMYDLQPPLNHGKIMNKQVVRVFYVDLLQALCHMDLKWTSQTSFLVGEVPFSEAWWPDLSYLPPQWE